MYFWNKINKLLRTTSWYFLASAPPKKSKSTAKYKSLLDMMPKMERSIPTAASSTEIPSSVPITHLPLNLEATQPGEEVSVYVGEKDNVPLNSMDTANVFGILKSLTSQEKVELKQRIWKPNRHFSFPRNENNLRCRIEWIEKYIQCCNVI